MIRPDERTTTPSRRAPLRTAEVLLLDTSASMALGEPRRIDLLWSMVLALRTPQSRWRVAVFNSFAHWSAVLGVPAPEGTTNLAGAFTLVSEVAPKRVTVVTDGEPDDPEAALRKGIALGCPINILFVGDPAHEPALTFCQQLCTRTGGTFATEVLSPAALAQATATMRTMLGAGAPPPSIAL